MPTKLSRRRAATMGMAALAFPKVTASFAKSQEVSVQFSSIHMIAEIAVAKKLIPGITIAAYKDDTPVFTHAAGLGSLELNVRMAVDSILGIASVTKQFTAAAILLLAEDGKLSLDDPLSRFIPEFPHANELILRRMLNHTSGLGSVESFVTFVQALGTYAKYADSKDEQSALLKAIAAHKPILDYSPGKEWAYSNTAYALLGVVIDRASGQHRHDFMRNRIFMRLGLTDTAVDTSSEVVQRRVSGYVPQPNVSCGFENAPFMPMSFVGACGDIRSSALDLCRWHSALLGGKLLRPEGLKEMLTPARLANGSLPKSLPKENGGADEYGFGLYLSSVNGHQRIGHGGGGLGFSAMVFTFPDKHFTAAYLVNCDDGGLDPAPSDKPLDAIYTALTRVALA